MTRKSKFFGKSHFQLRDEEDTQPHIIFANHGTRNSKERGIITFYTKTICLLLVYNSYLTFYICMNVVYFVQVSLAREIGNMVASEKC